MERGEQEPFTAAAAKGRVVRLVLRQVFENNTKNDRQVSFASQEGLDIVNFCSELEQSIRLTWDTTNFVLYNELYGNVDAKRREESLCILSLASCAGSLYGFLMQKYILNPALFSSLVLSEDRCTATCWLLIGKLDNKLKARKLKRKPKVVQSVLLKVLRYMHLHMPQELCSFRGASFILENRAKLLRKARCVCKLTSACNIFCSK